MSQPMESSAFSAHHAREENVVLEVDMPVQIHLQALQVEVERPPGFTGPGGQGEVVGEPTRALQVRQMVFVLGHHHLDGHEGHGAATGENEWKENLLFLGEVAFDRLENLCQVVGQSGRTQVLLLVRRFDEASAITQGRQVAAQGLVKAPKNEIDDGGRRLCLPIGAMAFIRHRVTRTTKCCLAVHRCLLESAARVSNRGAKRDVV